jgi:hypothetical protein
MDLTVVYPPMDSKLLGVRVFNSLEEIPESYTRDAGFRAYTITIPDREHIDGGKEFRAQSSPREMLEGWDRERFHPSRKTKGEAEATEPGAVNQASNIVVLYSSVEGIPPTHCHLLNSPEERVLFRVPSAIDVGELAWGETTRKFSPPLTLQPELYTLDDSLTPVLWQGEAKAAR